MRRDEARSLGPVCLKRGYAPKHVLGSLFVLIGAQILAFAYDNLFLSSPWGFAGHLLVGSFVAFNGLYLSGLRFRSWPTDDRSGREAEMPR